MCLPITSCSAAIPMRHSPPRRASWRRSSVPVSRSISTWRPRDRLPPGTTDGSTLHASMQCPYYLKKALVHALGCRKEDVRVIQPHTGGGFGGKEHYPDVLATAAAIASRKLDRPVMIVTRPAGGHPVHAEAPPVVDPVPHGTRCRGSDHRHGDRHAAERRRLRDVQRGRAAAGGVHRDGRL